MAASDPHLRGADRVREMFTWIRNGDDGVADLYAEDGVALAAGHRVERREAIRAFCRRAIEGSSPKPEVHVVLDSAP